MATHIALLRAVNLGSHNKIAMADLRDLLAKLRLRDAQTLLQSGNVVFSSTKRDCAPLELLLERGAEKNLALKTAFFVRSAAEWSDIVEANPFPREAKSDPGRLILMTMKSVPGADAVAALKAAVKGRETFRIVGSCLYAVYPDGQGTSKFSVGLIERKLGTSVTGRNWNTVLKIRALLG
jgi:uncharacterized protein (DUF1697 family)